MNPTSVCLRRYFVALRHFLVFPGIGVLPVAGILFSAVYCMSPPISAVAVSESSNCMYLHARLHALLHRRECSI